MEQSAEDLKEEQKPDNPDQEQTEPKSLELTKEQWLQFYDEVQAREKIKHKRKDLKVDFREITVHNVGQLKALLNKTLPVTYSHDFYNRLTSFVRYSKLAYFKDILIGAITCKEHVKKMGDEQTEQRGAYIMTITVFKPYRRYGIASKLLEKAIHDCCQSQDINYIFLDVQEGNDAALEFYKKHGFVVSHKEENYYTNIEPADSYFLYKKLDQKENNNKEENDNKEQKDKETEETQQQ